MTIIAQDAAIAIVSGNKEQQEIERAIAVPLGQESGAIAVEAEIENDYSDRDDDYNFLEYHSDESEPDEDTLALLDFFFSLGFAPGDLVSAMAINPKKTPNEELLKRGLAFQKNGSIISLPVTGFLTLGETSISFTKQIKPREGPFKGQWIVDQRYKPYKDGVAQLRIFNEKGQGIYFRANDCNGGHLDQDAVRCQNFFYECDGLPKQQQWEKLKEMRSLGLKDRTVVETRNSLHVYYATTEDEVEGWTTDQQRLVQHRGSDKSIINPGRLMRLPGFLHWQYNEETKSLESFLVRIVEQDLTAIHSRLDFEKVLPEWCPKFWDEKGSKSSTSSKAKGDRSKSSHFSSTENSWLDGWNINNFAHFLNNYNPNGRGDEWATAECPAHTRKGQSQDSLHINKITGAFKPHCGCDTGDVYKAAMAIARANGYKFPNSQTSTSTSESTKPILTEEEQKQEEARSLNRYELKVESEQKYLNSITIKPHWRILETHTRYFFDEIQDKIPKGEAALVLSPIGMGRGKTTKNKKILQDRPNDPVFSITSTLSLQRGQAKDMKLVPCSDVESIYQEGHGVVLSKSDHIQNCHRFAICPPSLHHVINYDSKGNIESYFDKQDVIIPLDEFRTVLQFLLQSSLTNTDGKRPKNIAALKWLLQDAIQNNALILVDDANLTNVEIDFLTELCPDIPVYLVTSTYKEPEITYNFYSQDEFDDDGEEIQAGLDKAQFYIDMMKAVKDGPLMIPCDSKKLNAALEAKLNSLGLKGLRADANTTDLPEIKDLINAEKEDFNRVLAEHKPNYFMFSPIMGQSKSIELTEEYVDAIQEILRMTREGASPEAIAEAEVKAKILAENWEKLTPYFKNKFAINTHLGPCEFEQMMGRDRFNIPTFIYSSERELTTGHSRSPLTGVQLNTLLQNSEDLIEIAEIAKAQLQREQEDRKQRAIAENDVDYLNFLEFQDFEQGTNTSDQILDRAKKIQREALEGLHPELTASARQRARTAHEQRNRRENLKKHLKVKGHRVLDIEVKEADTSLKKQIKEIQKQLLYSEAKAEVNAPLINEDERKKLKRKPSNTLEERNKLARYYFEAMFPQLLSKFDNPVDFYFEAVKEDRGHYLAAVKLHWDFLNREALIPEDIKSLEIMYQHFDQTGCAPLQDQKKLRSGMFKFVEEWGLFEVVEKNEISRADLEPLLKYVAKGKQRRQLKAYFDSQPPSDEKKIIPWVNRILSRFAFKLSETHRDASGLRYYNLVTTKPKNIPSNARENILSILADKKASKLDSNSLPQPPVVLKKVYINKKTTGGEKSCTTEEPKTKVVVHEGEEKEAVVPDALFEIGQDVEGIIDGVLEIGLVCDRLYCDADCWLYTVELVDGCEVFMYEHMLQRPNHDKQVIEEVVDVVALVDAAVRESEPFWTPESDTPDKTWQRRLNKAQVMGVDIALKLYNCQPRELITQTWNLLTAEVQQFYLSLFSSPATAIA
ncbi:MAG: hypothetical protein PUP93_25785 [Rhizonema sp. NSF051]|nr:hypothetical protein [Rhizonema sp. NSF051]